MSQQIRPQVAFEKYDLSEVEKNFSQLFDMFAKFGERYIISGFVKGDYKKSDLKQMFFLFFGGAFSLSQLQWKQRQTLSKTEHKVKREDMECMLNRLAGFFDQSFGFPAYGKNEKTPTVEDTNVEKLKSGLKAMQKESLRMKIEKAMKDVAAQLDKEIESGEFERNLRAFKAMFGHHFEPKVNPETEGSLAPNKAP